jgi:hypothetical protein
MAARVPYGKVKLVQGLFCQLYKCQSLGRYLYIIAGPRDTSMVKLTKLIKTIVGIVLFNKAIRSGLITLLMTSIIRCKESSLRKSNSLNGLLALLEIVAASILAMRTKSDGTAQQRGDLDIGGQLADLIKTMAGNRDDRSQIIESNDYTIIEEKR